jgi:hypothetical protein
MLPAYGGTTLDMVPPAMAAADADTRCATKSQLLKSITAPLQPSNPFLASESACEQQQNQGRVINVRAMQGERKKLAVDVVPVVLVPRYVLWLQEVVVPKQGALPPELNHRRRELEKIHLLLRDIPVKVGHL